MYDFSKLSLDKWSGDNLKLTWEEYLVKTFDNLTDEEASYIMSTKELRFDFNFRNLVCTKIKDLSRFIHLLKCSVRVWHWCDILKYCTLTSELLDSLSDMINISPYRSEIAMNPSIPLEYLRESNNLKKLDSWWILQNQSVPLAIFEDNVEYFVEEVGLFRFATARPWRWDFMNTLLTMQTEYDIMDLENALVGVSSSVEFDEETLTNLKVLVELKK